MNVADEFLELVKERGQENLQDVATSAKAIKGLAELVKGSVESGKRNKSQPFSLCFCSTVIKFVYTLMVRLSLQRNLYSEELRITKAAKVTLHFHMANTCTPPETLKRQRRCIKRQFKE